MKEGLKKLVEIAEHLTVDDIYQLPPHEYDAIRKAVEQIETVVVVGQFRNNSYCEHA